MLFSTLSRSATYTWNKFLISDNTAKGNIKFVRGVTEKDGKSESRVNNPDEIDIDIDMDADENENDAEMEEGNDILKLIGR